MGKSFYLLFYVFIVFLKILLLTSILWAHAMQYLYNHVVQLAKKNRKKIKFV